MFQQFHNATTPRFETLFESILNESSDDEAFYKYIDLKDAAMQRFINEILSNPNEPQKWETLPADKVIALWRDYAKYRAVRDPDAVNELAFTMAMITAKLEVNTEMSGHTQSDPKELWRDNYGEEMPPEIDEKIGDFILDPKAGQWRISDAGLDKLVPFAIALLSNESPEEKLVDMDRMLQVCHMRSDLAANYIEGGTDTLDTLFKPEERPTGVTSKSLIPDDEDE